MTKKTVWTVIPAFNESKHISKVVKEIKKYTKDVIVVDDGSKDKTSELAKTSGAIILRHIINLGKVWYKGDLHVNTTRSIGMLDKSNTNVPALCNAGNHQTGAKTIYKDKLN